MEKFKHDYVVADEHGPEGKTLCMSCASPVVVREPKEAPDPGNPQKKIWVWGTKPLSHYEQVPVLVLRPDRDKKSHHKTVIHLQFCKQCARDFILTPEAASLIKDQIFRARAAVCKFYGYPQEMVEAERRSLGEKILARRLIGEELVNIYRKEPIK